MRTPTLFFSLLMLSITQAVGQENYVRTDEFLEATTEAGKGVRTRAVTTYYDGLGRERWRVATGANGVSPVTSRTDYDRRGNVWRQWLPVGGDVRDINSHFSKAAALYGYSERPFTESDYEESGRNRPILPTGPGYHWKDRGVKTSYHRCELSGDYACRILVADYRSGEVTIGRIYGPGTLAVTEVTDEDGMRTLSFENRDGNVILERRIDAGRRLIADTRFVYDIRKDLRYIISPEGVQQIGDGEKVDNDILEQYAQAFEYDFRHRMISSRMPGCGTTEYVYDKFGRVIMCADAGQRAKGEWTVTKYDQNMRPAVRGTVGNLVSSREILQSLYGEATFEESFNADFDRIESALQYTNTSGPAGFVPYEAWYYDKYTFMGGPSASKRTFFETPHDVGANYSATGLCTGRAYIDAIGLCYLQATKYDGHRNAVASMEWDCYCNIDRYSTETDYNFTNRPVKITETYEKLSECTVTSTRTATHTFTYDDWGRVADETLSVDGGAAVSVCRNVYDDIGRLVSRKLGNTEVLYEFDIRQHATGIVADAYTERASYTKGPDNNTRSYKYVNATTDSWRSGSSITMGYTYDGLGRMAEAVSTDGTLSERLEVDLDANVTGVVRRYNNAVVQDAVISMAGALPDWIHDVSTPYYAQAVGRFASGDYTMTYDRCGRLTADGTRAVTAVTYHPWLNLPRKISFDGGEFAQSDYWPDGTLRARLSRTRRIAMELLTSNSSQTAEPAAAETNATSQWTTTTRTYRGSFEIATGGESYARVNTSTGYYDCKEKRHYYYLTNRQGSVMAVVDDAGNTVQRTGFYPSGTPFVLPSDYGMFTASISSTLTPATDRLHIGNRWLGHGGLNRYDNSARLHDPLLLRFDIPDPLASKFPNLNPWTHTAANPANAIDPDGLATFFMNSRDELVRVGDDGNEDNRLFVVNKSLGKQIRKLTDKGEKYTGPVGNNNKMTEITNITDFSAIENAIADGNSDGYERGMNKDQNGTMHIWDIGTEVKAEGNTIKHGIVGFQENGKRTTNKTENINSMWYMHFHPIHQEYKSFGNSYPSKEDKTFDIEMRNSNYNGTTFLIGGKNMKMTFYFRNKSIMTIPYEQLKKLIINQQKP